MKPYSYCGALTPRQAKFNCQLSRARFVTENAFGRLKGRWSLLKLNDTGLQNMIQLVAAWCIMHNNCEVHGDSFDASWQVESDTNVSSSETPSAAALGIIANRSDIRKALATYFVMSWQLMHVHTQWQQSYYYCSFHVIFIYHSTLLKVMFRAE